MKENEYIINTKDYLEAWPDEEFIGDMWEDGDGPMIAGKIIDTIIKSLDRRDLRDIKITITHVNKKR